MNIYIYIYIYIYTTELIAVPAQCMARKGLGRSFPVAAQNKQQRHQI